MRDIAEKSMKTIYTNIDKDIYIIPSSIEGLCLLYSPLRDISFLFAETLCTEILGYYQNGATPKNVTIKEYISQIENTPFTLTCASPDIDTENRAVIILTQKCNLACSYCYAQHSRTQDILSFEQIKHVVDYIFSKNNGKKKSFSFIGGGEPLVCWDVLQQTCDYIKIKSIESEIAYNIGIITNATLLTEDKIRWIAQNNIRVSVSFDILPDIQNTQRPFAFKKSHSFDAVKKAILLLNQYNVKFKTRTTITQNIIERMPEMVEFIAENFPFLRSLHLEPVTDTNVDYQVFYPKFLKYFMDAYTLGQSKEIDVENSLTHSFFHIKHHFCMGELCITPKGLITACHRHSNQKDPHYERCLYGIVDDSHVVINQNHLDKVIQHRKSYSKKCANCFAKWHCAGGCFSQGLTLNAEQRKEYCSYVKKFTRDFLEKQITKINV